MAFWIYIHGCQPYPKIAIYVVNQLTVSGYFQIIVSFSKFAIISANIDNWEKFKQLPKIVSRLTVIPVNVIKIKDCFVHKKSVAFFSEFVNV